MKAVKPEAPESAEQWVATLDKSELSRIKLPDDPGVKVFVMHEGSWPLAEADEPHPWITVYANGRIGCRSRMSKGTDQVSGTLSEDELTWLMHLAVNKCRLLERKTADYEVKNSRNAHGYFSYQLAVESGSNRLQLPQDALVIKSLRRKLDLYALKELHTYVGDLANRVHLGDEREAARVLKAVNEELERTHPDIPGFALQHLALADRGNGSRFVCSFNRKIELGDRQIEEVTAVYVLEGKQPKVTVNVRKYTQG